MESSKLFAIFCSIFFISEFVYLDNAVPLYGSIDKINFDFPEDLNSFADSAECKDQRDCSWITNESAKQSDGGQTLEEYCKLHRDEPSVKQCSKTCNFCKAPSPAEFKIAARDFAKDWALSRKQSPRTRFDHIDSSTDH
ncbi:uncharacterized protein LOC111326906 isoform X2 [Stylophora pistillata]|uniref:uncharacterized protein LOC111326906 isoform X2 n=1 Tax=Stylophora pistillata TaxID=50429 RepID=UPI000C03C06E|nr:uncharacterized protein LOC111326906 isoform X2 [Stylophora pistillata]